MPVHFLKSTHMREQKKKKQNRATDRTAKSSHRPVAQRAGDAESTAV